MFKQKKIYTTAFNYELDQSSILTPFLSPNCIRLLSSHLLFHRVNKLFFFDGLPKLWG